MWRTWLRSVQLCSLGGEIGREDLADLTGNTLQGDLEEPDWRDAYWGSNYPRLYELKKIWDPTGVFYARLTPGTEDWEVIDDGTRLCQGL